MTKDNIKEIKQQLEKTLSKYKFISEGHYYLCNGEKVGISATSFIHKYVNEFESDKIAPIMAKK